MKAIFVKGHWSQDTVGSVNSVEPLVILVKFLPKILAVFKHPKHPLVMVLTVVQKRGKSLTIYHYVSPSSL